MRNSEKTANGKSNKARERLAYFFKETFRPHSKEEYAEVFTRGFRGGSGRDVGIEESTVGADKVVVATAARKLPWLYMRVFALNFIIFSVLALTFTLARYTAGYLTAILFGGLLFNIPLFIFFYELYPRRDISLVKLVSVVLIGGVVSTVIILFGYEFIYSTTEEPNPWISTLWVGFWEEFVKGAVAISAVVLLKTKNPFACFLIGFAVGTGYSFAEDIGYIYSLSRSYGAAWLVLTSVGRGLSCVCSHAPWTAIICWGFAKFRKPFLNFKFYLTALASMVLHYFADVPFFDENLNILRGVTVGWAIEAVVVAAIFVIVFLMLRNSLKSEEKAAYPPIVSLKKSAKLSASANLTAVLCAAAFSVFTLVGCILPVGEKVIDTNIYGKEEFLYFIQNGLELQADWEREFDEETENYTEFIAGGERRYATQKVDGEYEYFYVYSFTDGVPELENIGVKIENGICYCRKFLIYNDYYLVGGGYPAGYDPIRDGFKDEVEGGGEEGEEPDGGGDVEENVPPVVEKPDESTEEPDVPQTPEEPPTGEPEEPPVEEPDAPESPEEPAPEPKEVISFFNVVSKSCGYSVADGCFTVYTGETEFEGLASVVALAVLSGVALTGGAAAFIALKIKSRRYRDD